MTEPTRGVVPVGPRVREMLDVDPADLAAWLPAVESGERVLLPDLPGSLPLVREAVAFGVVALVDVRMDESAMQQARELAVRREVASEELKALTEHLRERLAAGRGGVPDARTSPRVLFVALTKEELSRASTGCRRLERWGATPYLVTSTSLARAHRALVPAGARVTTVPDPGGAWIPSRIERALVLRAPRILTGRAVRLVKFVAARGPRQARLIAGRSLPMAERINERRSRTTMAAHRRFWSPLLVRVKPALVARALVPQLDQIVEAPADLDLLCAPGADSLALVWRMLRELPELRTTSSVTGHAITQAVRDRVQRLVAA